MIMCTIFKLAWAYLCHDKKQTLALFVGIVLSAALFCGVGSLFSSGLNASRENARTEYGDWHYETRCDLPWFDDFLDDPSGAGYQLRSYGVEKVCKAIEEPFAIQYVSADDGYMQMMGRTLEKGRMPRKLNEIAMDVQTLRNLGASAEIGEQVTLDGETFTLTGIVGEMPPRLSELMGDFMQVFVSSDLDYGTNGSFVYLKFDESRSVGEQIAAFSERFNIDPGTIARNNGIAGYVGADGGGLSFEEIIDALKAPTFGIPYVWGSLNENQVMTEGAVLAALALFVAFIIYSIFQVSVLRRLNQYSILQTLGLTDGGVLRLLLCELLIIFAAGYTTGCVLGNSIAALIYGKIGQIFIVRNAAIHSGVSSDVRAEALSAATIPSSGIFQIDWQLIVVGACFLVFLLVIISGILMHRMRRMSLHQMLKEDNGRPRSRKIVSLRHISLVGAMTRRFMFARKSTFIGIVVSLAIGGVIFLSATYVIENTRVNNTLTFAADDGLGSDIQLVEEKGLLSETVSMETVDALREVDGVAQVLPVSYMLGEITLNDGSFQWPSYYAETAGDSDRTPDPEVMARYGGVIVQTGEDDYRLKVNIYGYDDAMLAQMNEYLLEGSIDPDAMRAEDTVIMKTLVDGQGNYDGIDLGAGERFVLKTPRVSEEALLDFEGVADDYETQSFSISALVSRPLGKVDTTIGDDGETTVDIIMTQEQMKAHFGVTGAQTVSIRLKDDADPEAVANAVREMTMGIPGCVVHDYSGQIAAQELYLHQQMAFFYGIAGVLLLTSLIHIANSMHWLVAERRREFSILRAMGITDRGFLSMLLKEGMRYGIYASVVMIVLYSLVQRVLYYFMNHVYLYLHPASSLQPGWILAVVIINVILCMGTMGLAGKCVLKRSILR